MFIWLKSPQVSSNSLKYAGILIFASIAITLGKFAKSVCTVWLEIIQAFAEEFGNNPNIKLILHGRYGKIEPIKKES